jgi:CobQ-like glutamine amidotransferase family enzyme
LHGAIIQKGHNWQLALMLNQMSMTGKRDSNIKLKALDSKLKNKTLLRSFIFKDKQNLMQ